MSPATCRTHAIRRLRDLATHTLTRLRRHEGHLANPFTNPARYEELEPLEQRLLLSGDTLGFVDFGTASGTMLKTALIKATAGAGNIYTFADLEAQFDTQNWSEPTDAATVKLFVGTTAGLSVGWNVGILVESDILNATSGYAFEISHVDGEDVGFKFARAITLSADVFVGGASARTEQYVRGETNDSGGFDYYYGVTLGGGWFSGFGVMGVDEFGIGLNLGIGGALSVSAGVQINRDYILQIETPATAEELLFNTGNAGADVNVANMSLALADTLLPLGTNWVTESLERVAGGLFGVFGEAVVDSTLDTASPLYQLIHSTHPITGRLLQSTSRSGEIATSLTVEAGIPGGILSLEGGVTLALSYSAEEAVDIVPPLHLTSLDAAPSTYRPGDDAGDSRLDALLLNDIEEQRQVLTFDSATDEDWIRLSARGGHIYHYYTEPMGGASEAPAFEIYRLDSTAPLVVSSSASLGRQHASFVLDSSDPYCNEDVFMRIRNDAGTAGSYAVSLVDVDRHGEAEVTDSVGDQDDSAMGFGQVPIGSSRTETITVTNRGNDDLVLGSWLVAGSGFSVAPINTVGPDGDVTLTPGQSTDINVTFAPTAVTSYSAAALIGTSDLADLLHEVALSGTGVADQSNADLVITPGSGQMGSAFTATATVRDGYGNLVGAGHEVGFSTLMAGQWSGYDRIEAGVAYRNTNSSGQASVTFTPSETGTGLISAQSAVGGTDTATFTVTQPSLKFQNVSLTKYAGNDTYSDYRYSLTVTDLSGVPMTNELISFAVSGGTLLDAETRTNGGGHADMHFRVTSSGTIAITTSVLGSSNTTTHPVWVGPVPTFPAGPVQSLGVSPTAMDVSASGNKVVFGGARSVGVLDLTTGSVWTRNNSNELHGDILSVAISDDGTKIGIGSAYRERSIVTVGGGIINYVTSSSEAIGDGQAALWIDGKLLLGHYVNTSKLHQYSLYSNTATLLGKLQYHTENPRDIAAMAIRPNSSGYFAAVSDGSASSGHNFVYYGRVSGSSISIYSAFTTGEDFRNRGVAFTADGSRLVVGSVYADKLLAVYNVNSLGSSPTIISMDHGGNYIAFSSDGAYMAVADEMSSMVTIFDCSGSPTSWSPVFKVQLASACRGLEFLAGSRQLLAASSSGLQRVYLNDTEAPSILFTAPSSGHQTYAGSIAVAGNATDNVGMASARYRINGGSWTDLTLGDGGAFSFDATLAIGDNAIEVEATDVAGWTATNTLSVRQLSDTTGPIITPIPITPAAVRPGASVAIAATVQDPGKGVDASSVVAHIQRPDESTVATVTLTDTDADGTYEGTWNSTGFASGKYQIDITASDQAGNPSESDNAGSVTLNAAPTIAIGAPSVNTFTHAGDAASVSFAAGDIDSEATISLFLDTDTDPGNGVVAIPAQALPESTDYYTFDPAGIELGTYRFYAVVTDEIGQATAWSSGRLIIAAPLPGDANNDGVVSADDFASVQTNFGDTGAADGWLLGDANDDGVVSADDFAAIQVNFGNVYPVSTAAEPVQPVAATATAPASVTLGVPLVNHASMAGAIAGPWRVWDFDSDSADVLTLELGGGSMDF